MQVLIPLSPDNLGGPSVTVSSGFEIEGQRDQKFIVWFLEKPEQIEWFEKFESLYCQQQHSPETLKVIRKATDDDFRLFRVAVWIQNEDEPECCGKKMFFVGQIDDDHICTERPAGARFWWHDRASFYVFTCSQCLECKAVGQQF